MAKYRIAILPGDGVGVDVIEAAKIVLEKMEFDAEYIEGDIGWEFWCKEGNPLPTRTTEMLKTTDACLFGAITSKPNCDAVQELAPELKDKGLSYFSPIVRLRQEFNLQNCHNHGNKAEDRPNGEIDMARDDDEHHPGRHHCHRGGLD